MSTKSQTINRDLVLQVGSSILSGQLAGHRDPGGIGGDHLDRLADLSVRAALALDAAIPRAEERLAAEARAAEEAEAAVKAAEKAAEQVAAKAAKEVSDANKATAAATVAAAELAAKEKDVVDKAASREVHR